MGDSIITKDQLIEAGKNADAWEKYWAGSDDENVITRLNKEYPTHAKALKVLMENGGMQPFQTEVELLAYVPIVEPTTAKALDTKKVWLWKDGAWINTGLAEKDLAEVFTLEQIDLNNQNFFGEKADLNALFIFEDTDGNVVAVIKPDGNIVTSKGDFHSLGGETQLLKDQNEQISGDITIVQKNLLGEKADLNALFLFEDAQGEVVAVIKPDGNIVTSKANLNQAQQDINHLNQFGQSIEITNDKILLNNSENLFEFEDATGKKVITFKKSGVIQLNGETNLSCSSVNCGESSTGIFQKEYAENDYLNLNLQRLLLSNVSTLSPFVGSHKQQFSIKNTSDFLNLKISQGNVISIDTPYYTKDSHIFSNQVVHPYICKFSKTVMGYKWIVLLTPFHSTNDMYENPCVYGSNDLKNFELLNTFDQPLMNILPTGFYNYNSDPSCVFNHQTGEFCVISRNTQVINKENVSKLYLLKTKDFVSWDDPVEINSPDTLSPTVVFDTNLKKWVMFGYKDSLTLTRRMAEHLTGPWSEVATITPPFGVWHQEVRFCGGHYIGVFGDNKLQTGGALYLGISTDGVTWQFSADIFQGMHLPAYKPSISHEFVDSTHIKFHIVWTSSDISGVLNEKWKLLSAETQPIEVI